MVVHVLHNPAAAKPAQRVAQSIISKLTSDGHRVVDLTATTPQASSQSLATAVERGEVERLVIAGGDGLVHLAIQHVATTGVGVTIAPIGSGNDFATALQEHATSLNVPGFSSDLIKVTATDGAITWAASVAIAGFPADINARANTMGRVWGSSVYALATARELPTFRRRTFELSIDEIPITTNSAMLAIGNTKYFGGGMLPCPDALPDDGSLHLTSIENVGRRGLVPHLLGRAGGTADRGEVLQGVGKRIEVDTARHDFWADGEPLGTSPLTFEIVPNALVITQVAESQ